MKKNKILLIGYGKIGQKYFSILRNLNQSVYIYDTNVNVLKKKINFVDIKNTNTLKIFLILSLLRLLFAYLLC